MYPYYRNDDTAVIYYAVVLLYIVSAPVKNILSTENVISYE